MKVEAEGNRLFQSRNRLSRRRGAWRSSIRGCGKPEKGVDLIIGRPEIDAWGIVFTPEGPKPRRVPIEFEIL
jgi:hypothetical protein